MERNISSTVQKLMRSFMWFKRAEWHQRSMEGCTISEIKVLFCLKRGIMSVNSDIRVSEISKLLHVTSPTITQLLKGLEANGLVERRNDPHDRRAVSILLTEKGEAITQKAMDDMSTIFQGLIEYLGEERSNQLVRAFIRGVSVL